MTRLLAQACLFLVLLTSCNFTSDNPAGGQRLDEIPQELLGVWRVERVLDGMPSHPTQVTISREGSGLIRFVVQKGNETSQLNAVLTRVGGNLVASTQSDSDSGSWTFGALEIDAASGLLKIKIPDSAVIKSDIEDGVLQGDVYDDPWGHALHIRASAESLTKYLESKPQLFKGVAAELRKSY